MSLDKSKRVRGAHRAFVTKNDTRRKRCLQRLPRITDGQRKITNIQDHFDGKESCLIEARRINTGIVENR